MFAKQVVWRQDAYACDNQDWPVFYLGEGSVNFSLTGAADGLGKRRDIRESDLDDCAREVNFRDFETLCEHILGVRRGHGNSALEIRAPIYALIDEVTVSEEAIHILGRTHDRLKGLRVDCSILHFDKMSGYGGSAPTFVGSSTVETNSMGENIIQFSKEFSLQDPPESGSAKVALFIVAPSRVDLMEEQVLLRSGIPVFKTFGCFVPESDVEEYVKCLAAGTSVLNCRLYKQFKARDASKKVEELLEYVVNYVLALCQLSPLYLSNPQYDVLTGNLSAGSADILATTTHGDPLIVSCTMAMPDDKKRGMLLAARTAIANRLKWEPNRIKTLLITGKPSVPSAGSEVKGFDISSLPIPSTNTEIKELGAENLREIWALIQHGNLYAAQQALGAR